MIRLAGLLAFVGAATFTWTVLARIESLEAYTQHSQRVNDCVQTRLMSYATCEEIYKKK